jgi:hypothetical protein
MKCKNCKKEIVPGRYKKSAEIPSRPEHHYIICEDCGNVMIARYVNGEICDEEMGNRILSGLHNTPTNDSMETMAMMREAAELFRQSGSSVTSFTYSSNGAKKPIKELEPAKLPEEKILEAIEEVDVRDSDIVLQDVSPVATETYTEEDINIHKSEVLESTEYTHPPISFFTKVTNWIKHLFKK